MFSGKHSCLTEVIIGSFYDVYNELGYGFSEKVYENALSEELREKGLNVSQQEPIDVYFHGKKVGEYFADLVVNGKVVVELKAVRQC